MGTGGPINNSKRLGATSFAIISPKDFLLIDCGSGTWRNADLTRLPAGKLTKVFITHFHSDHIGDLGEVCFGSWVRGRSSPLEVYGPDGIQDVVEGFQKAYNHDSEYRIAHHGQDIMPTSGSRMNTHQFSIENNEDDLIPVYKDNHVKVEAFVVHHEPIRPAVGYRIEIEDKVFVYTGDTRYFDFLPNYCKNADILCANSVSHKFMAVLSDANARINKVRIAKITKDVIDYQMDPAQAGILAAESNVKRLVLVHLTPPILNLIMKRRVLKAVKEHYTGSIIVGRDRMVLDL